MAHILIVDDRATNRRYLCGVLEADGHTVAEAAHGGEGLAALRAQAFDLVISDLSMPVMDGFAFVQQARADPRLASTRFIFYTATYRNRAAYELADEVGVVDVLPKPASPRELRDAVHAALGRPGPGGTSAIRAEAARHLAEWLEREEDGRRLLTLTELVIDLADETDNDRFLRVFCDAARRIVDCSSILLALLDPDADGAVRLVCGGRAGLPATIGGPGPLPEALLRRARTSVGVVRSDAGGASLLVAAGPPQARSAVLLFGGPLGRPAFGTADEALAQALAAEFALLHERLEIRRSLQAESASRVRALHARTEALAQLDAVVQSASDAIVGFDRERRVRLFNPAAERIFGRRAADVTGAPIDALLSAADLARLQAWLGPADGASVPPPNALGAAEGLRADGTRFAMELSLSATDTADGLLCTAILRDVSERLLAEQARAHYRDQLSAFTQRLLEQEKRTASRLAQLLHDELGQTLAAMRLVLDASATSGDADGEPQTLRLRLDRLLDGAIAQVRDQLVEWRPTSLDEGGLAAALDAELQRWAPLRPQARIHFVAPEAVRARRWPEGVEYALFMVAREAIANAFRHARASRVRVTLEAFDGGLRVCVADDGRGLPAEAPTPTPGHLGMVGMRERARAIGARLDIESAADRGTTVSLQWRPGDGPVAADR